MAPLHSRVSMTLAIAASTAVALTGCSKATSVSATADAAPASGVDVTAVRQVVDSVKKAPTFTAPGPAFDVSKVRGKTILNVSLNSTVPFNQIVDKAMGEAAKAAGVRLIQYTNQGQPAQWIQGIQSGIAQKVDLIVLEGSPDPQLLGPQIKAARDAGIPVISTHLYDASFASGAAKLNPNVTTFVPANHYRAGTLMADYAIAHSGGKVNAFFVASNEVQPSAGIAKAFSDELAKRCPSTCKAKVSNIPIADWATKVPTAVQTALISDPTINYVVPVFDGMTPNLVTGITQAGKQGQVSIVAYNGTASVMQMIQRKNLVVAEIGEPLEWLGWANVDQAMRVLAGAKPLVSEKTPLRLFDASNINDAGNPVNQTDGYGSTDFKSGYRALWGLS